MEKRVFLLALILLVLLSNFVIAVDIKELALKLNRIELLNGDANADGRVNIFDLASIGLYYGSKQGDSNWNWKADVANTINRIDIFDLAEIGLNYGNNYVEIIDDPVFISPPIKNVSLQQVFTIDVNISTPAEVYAADFILNFNPNILEALNVAKGDFLTKDGAESYEIVEIDNVTGKIEFASTRLGTQAGVSGAGKLAQVEFRAKNLGTSQINFENITLINSNLNKISNVSTINGLVNVLAGELPFIISYNIDNPYISPNNDNIKDNVTIDLEFSETVDYQIEIINSSDFTVKKWTGTAKDPQPKFWDGQVSSVVEGKYKIRVTMEDVDENVAVDESREIVVDITAPVINSVIKTPEPSYNTNDVSLTINISEKNLDNVKLEGNWEGIFKNYTLTGFSYLIKAKNFSNQENVQYRFYVFDLAGNSQTASGSFIVQNRKPVVNLANQQTNEDIKPALINLNSYISDLDGDSLSYVIISESNTALIDCEISGNFVDCSTPALNQFGNSNITIEASDGIENTRGSFLMSVLPVNDAPTIDSYSPETNPTIQEKESQEFSITKSDVDSIPAVKWYLNGNEVDNDDSYTFLSDANSQGIYSVKVVVSDGSLTAEHVWNLSVEDTFTRVELKPGQWIFSLLRNRQISFNELDSNCNLENLHICTKPFSYYEPSDSLNVSNYICLDENDVLYPGQGYFLVVKENCYIEMSGEKISQNKIGYLGTNQLIKGWNLMGSTSDEQVFSKGSCSLYGNVGPVKYVYNVTSCNGVKNYNNGYASCVVEYGISRCGCQVSKIEPGQGYWIRTANNCSLG